MTYDLMYEFKEYFKDNKVALDSYKMAVGYYYLIKKNGTLLRLIIRDYNYENDELCDYFKIRDFYSRSLGSNKVIGVKYSEVINKVKYSMEKKIYSNNIYTLFFKEKSIYYNNPDGKGTILKEFFIKGIEKYYDALKSLGDKKEDMLLNDVRYTEDEVKTNKDRMLSAFKLVLEDFMTISEEEKIKNRDPWIKIFLEEDEKEYIRVSDIYLKLSLFNNNFANVKVDGTIYGKNNYNYNGNEDKQFLKLKSTPFKNGSLVSIEEISSINRMFIWLDNNAVRSGFLKLPLNWNFHGAPTESEDINNQNLYLLRVTNNKSKILVEDYSYKSKFLTDIKPFIYRDYIKKKDMDIKIDKTYSLETLTNNIWIESTKNNRKNYIRDSYYDFKDKISRDKLLPNWKKEFLREYAGVFFDLFQKEEENNFIKLLNEIGTKVVENSIIEDFANDKRFLDKSTKAMNLWITFKIYFNIRGEGKNMIISDMQEICKDIVINKGEIKADEEYYYLMGQVLYYLLSHSKASKLSQDVVVPFIKATNVDALKRELNYLYEKYNYDIPLRSKRFNNIYSQILIHKPVTSVRQNKDILLAGVLSDNAFYHSDKEVKDGGNENGENE